MKKHRRLSLAEFRSHNTVIRMRCTLWVFLQGLPRDDVKTIREAVQDPTVQATAIAKVLRTRGFKGGHMVISRHRRSGCVTCDTL